MRRNHRWTIPLFITLTIINLSNMVIGYSIWDSLLHQGNQNVILIGVGSSVRLNYESQNFDENNLLIAENMAMLTSEDINTSISTKYRVDLVVKESSEIITPGLVDGSGETWFVEVKINDVLVENTGTDVTANASGALRFRIDFVQNASTTAGEDVVVNDFNDQGELIEAIAIIQNGVYVPTQFVVHCSIINFYTDAHSIALHGANVSYALDIEITKTPESMD